MKIQDLLLFTLAGLVDFFEEIHDPGDLFSNFYYNYYGFVPNNWKKQHLLRILSRCCDKKLISKNKSTQKITITPLARTKLYSKFPNLYWKNISETNKWYFVFFDIQETRRQTRDVFRYLLKQSGFVIIQRSVWVSPSSESYKFINNWINENNLSKNILIIKTGHVPKDFQNRIISQVWHLENIEEYLTITYKKLFAIKEKLDNNKEFDKTYTEFKKINSGLIEIFLTLPHLSKRFQSLITKYNKVLKLESSIKTIFIKKNRNTTVYDRK